MSSPAMVLTSAENPTLSAWDAVLAQMGVADTEAAGSTITPDGVGDLSVQTQIADVNTKTFDHIVSDIDLGLGKIWTGLKDTGLVILAILILLLVAYVWRAFR